MKWQCYAMNWALIYGRLLKLQVQKPYGYHPFYPGPGVSGHCIPVDPLYLQYIIQQKGIK